MKRSFTTLREDEVQQLAIGGFDGVHLAHQKLISHLDEKSGIVLAIVRSTLALTPKERRFLYIKNGGFMIDLEDIKDLTPLEFINYLTSEFPKLQKIIVGYDFSFGKERSGDVKLLKSLFDGDVEVVGEIQKDSISIHSRVIKEALQKGDIELANKLLGRRYQISASVVSGQGIGKEKLYPTLNLDVGDFFLPKSGVYATETIIEKERFRSVTFIGERLSTDNAFSIESYVIDEDIKNTPSSVEIIFKRFLRENRKFDNLCDLKDQIKNDIALSNTL